MSDKTEIQCLKEEIKKLKELAYKDELTSLYNRRGFRDGIEGFLSELKWSSERPEQRESVFIKNFSIILFDIDDFKKVNDTFGHDVGDKVLVFLSDVVRENIRDIDLSARWGGEEVILGLVGASEEDAYKIADRIREQVSSEKLKIDGKEIYFTISGGVASFNETGDFDEMFRCADKALYDAKKNGKNRIVKYSKLG